MPPSPLSAVVRHIRSLAERAPGAMLPDHHLLARFIQQHDEAAFALLVRRHGGLVLGVARRILHDVDAAEDVFQNTFLTLARRAASIRKPEALAGWLYGVAVRLASQTRMQDARRTKRERAAAKPLAEDAPDAAAWRELAAVLDEELQRLPDKYRTPLVLIYFAGHTQEAAARQLDWSLGTLRRRLERGKRLLHDRLLRRGVSLSISLLMTAIAQSAIEAALPALLVERTVQEAVGIAAVQATGWLFGTALLSRAKVAVMLSLILTAGAGFALFPMMPHPAAEEKPQENAPPPAPEANQPRVQRLGTARYRHGSRIESLAVSADGKLAAVASGWRSFSPARVFDLTDGRCLYSLPNESGSPVEAVGLSPDGKTLAVKDGKFLHFHDAATGKEIRKIKYIPDSGGRRSITSWLTFTPDGKQIAATLTGSAVRLIDVETGEVKRTFDMAAAARGCVFSPDGKRMASGGYEQEDRVYFTRLWEVATGKELQRFTIGNGLNSPIDALALSPDGKTLAGGSGHDGRVRLFDVSAGKELKVFPKIGNDIFGVVFAPDGKSIAAAGDSIHLYDPATGKERLRIDQRARGLAFSPDGSILIGAVRGAIYRWDAASGRQLTPSAALDSGVEQILIAADGRQLFTIDQDGSLYAWDTSGGKPPCRIAGEVGLGAVASPDGRFLAWSGGGSPIRLYDIAAQRFRDLSPTFSEVASVEAFLPDGKTLLTVDLSAAKVQLWDIESGKERRSFSAYPKKKPPHRVVWQCPYANRRVALSPDGKTLAIGDMDRDLPVGLWDMATGKLSHKLNARLTSVNDALEKVLRVEIGHLARPRIDGYMSSHNGLTFSPDGRFVVTWSENPFARSPTDHVAVWDAATGRAVTKLLTDRPIGAGSVAFAPDGRTLATASADGVIRLWETATWKVRAEFRGHRDRITALAFGPDGRLLTGGLDTVVLGWDIRPPRSAIRGTLAEAWEALTETDAKVGYKAQSRFLTEPSKAVEWFAARLAPAVRPNPAHINKLIADLDSDDFTLRERATADLAENGPSATAALREVIAKSASVEARRRAEGLLRDMRNGIIPPRELRALRAVEVLEWIATKQARAHLIELAKGASEARLTREAAAACKRLDERK